MNGLPGTKGAAVATGTKLLGFFVTTPSLAMAALTMTSFLTASFFGDADFLVGEKRRLGAAVDSFLTGERPRAFADFFLSGEKPGNVVGQSSTFGFATGMFFLVAAAYENGTALTLPLVAALLVLLTPSAESIF
jgi:hypothetical protein